MNKVQIKELDTASLHATPDNENPNHMEPEKYALLLEAIRRFGFLQPVLVRPRTAAGGGFDMVDGNHRLRVAIELGMTRVPCVVKEDASREDAIALQLAMNRNRGEINLATAADIIVDLEKHGWSIDQLTVTGFTGKEVEDLLAMARRTSEDVMVGPVGMSEDVLEEAEQFILEVEFTSDEGRKRAKKELRKLSAEGFLGDAILRLLDGEEE